MTNELDGNFPKFNAIVLLRNRGNNISIQPHNRGNSASKMSIPLFDLPHIFMDGQNVDISINSTSGKIF